MADRGTRPKTDALDPIDVNIVGGGTQYTEGDIDTTITGTAMLFEGASNTLRVPSDTYPLPVDITSLPNEGQQTMADSISVAIASNQTAVPVSGTITVSGTVTASAQPGVDIGDVDVLSLPLTSISATAVDASASGDNTIVSITNTPRLYYISLSANGANSADVTAIVKVGASTKYKVSLKAGAIWARNIGAGRSYVTGASGDDIVVNLSAAQTVHVSVEYADV